MNQATRPEVGSFFFLMTLVGVCGAAGQQSSCKGQVIQEEEIEAAVAKVGNNAETATKELETKRT